ncbi:sulfite exporter TauE/SafE family protein [Spongiactinospora sp. TRM90649]|uniref:sulfite exporter TauE/SafE family protein n=1 Tax=Spongiactinospora sp. TRM90649 TaxID=3031114 RepID=UPI0023F97F62|nr:sulfite exporter TauE/SafE family protein [Spongiactinospora sp. TRM90649]MDF5757927.1 sulfite exporter TauE/SafE family protein [Spongiactinospora sp. TRM90649]
MGLAVFVGAIVQGGVGFGLGLVAAPVVTILAPEVVPGALQVVNMTLPLFTLAAEWRRADLRGVLWAMLGRLPGSALGALVVVYVSVSALGVFVGLMVLVAVALTARSAGVPRNPATVAAAGFVSGVTGTATGVGGPPMGLVYQDAKGPQIRATLAMYFFLGAAQSLVVLWWVGELTAEAVRFGVVLVPCLVAGFLLSGRLRRYLDRGRVRAGVLGLATVSALALIAQSLVR